LALELNQQAGLGEVSVSTEPAPPGKTEVLTLTVKQITI
jgi:hypothetical protein